MDPQQQNMQQQGGAANSGQGFDPMEQMGYGGPNISFENFDDAAVQAAEAPKPEDTGAAPINVVNVNGVVSGRKLVDESWQKIAISAIVVAVGCLIGVVVAVIIANSLNGKISELNNEVSTKKSTIDVLYNSMGVSSQEDALAAINSTDVLDGSDLEKIQKTLTEAYGEDYVIDFADTTINGVVKNSKFKVVSLGIAQEEGTVRAILYARMSDGEWHKATFDKTNKDDPCKDSSEEDLVAIRSIGLCEEEEEI